MKYLQVSIINNLFCHQRIVIHIGPNKIKYVQNFDLNIILIIIKITIIDLNIFIFSFKGCLIKVGQMFCCTTSMSSMTFYAIAMTSVFKFLNRFSLSICVSLKNFYFFFCIIVPYLVVIHIYVTLCIIIRHYYIHFRE